MFRPSRRGIISSEARRIRQNQINGEMVLETAIVKKIELSLGGESAWKLTLIKMVKLLSTAIRD